MKLFRSCLTIFCFFLFGLGGFITGTVLFPILIIFIPKQKQRRMLSNLVHCLWALFVKIMVLFRLIDVNIFNKEHLKCMQGHVIVANHPTLLDIVLLISIIPNTVCVVKSGLLKNFFLKDLIRRIYLINTDETEDFLNKGKEILSQGLNIVIFPEGTRTDNLKNIKLHRGFAQLALRSNAPISLIRIDCSPLILGKKQKWYDVGEKTVHYHIRFISSIKRKVSENGTFYHQSKILSDLISSKVF